VDDRVTAGTTTRQMNRAVLIAAREESEIRVMGKKMYVGGLSWDTTDESLRSAFSKHGEVTEVAVIMDRDTGRSRGFGFVTMADEAGAKAAISALDGTSLDGRSIKVSEAKERSPRDNRGGGGRY